MEEKPIIVVVRQNKLNKQKTITVPKKLKSLKENDRIEFTEKTKGDVQIKKLK